MRRLTCLDYFEPFIPGKWLLVDELAPHANLRAQIVPSALVSVPEACDHHAQAASAPARRSWACLLKRVFDIDIEQCPRCGARLKIIAAIVDRQVIAIGVP